MALSLAALDVSAQPTTAVGTAAVVMPGRDTGYAQALARRGWQCVAVESTARLRPLALRETVVPQNAYACTVAHRGSMRTTVKALRAMGVSAVVAGSPAGIALAERIAWHLELPGADPSTSPLRYDRGAQAAALTRAGIPALRGVHATSLAQAVEWAAANPQPDGYELAPAAAGVPVQPVTCTSDLQISSAWPGLRRMASRYSGEAHLVLGERPPGRQYLLHSVTRLDRDGQPDHVVTDVWGESRTAAGQLDRTDLLVHHQLLSRALRMYVLRVLDVLGVVTGPVCCRVAFGEGRGPVLVSALASPVVTPADAELRAATGHGRVADVLDAVLPSVPRRLGLATTGRRVTRVHLHPQPGARIDPRLADTLRQLPTVAAVSEALDASAHASPEGADCEVVLSGHPEAIDTDHRTIRALEGSGLYRTA